MNSFGQFPLGARLPDSPHAVISSLPTMADVRGYEENEPRVLGALKSGYPRFVVHEYIQDLVEYYCQREGLKGRYVRLVSGRRAADDLLGWLGSGFEKIEVETSVYLVFCDMRDGERCRLLKKYVQHIGCGIASRQAEDLLAQYGLRREVFEEASFTGHALSQVEGALAEQIGCRPSDVLVAASGMNAFYAGFRAVQEFQRSRKRTAWIQLGWLYLDSGCVLEEFLGEDERLDCLYDVSDLEALLKRIRELGDSLAAVVIECPSNPLIQIGDLESIAAAVHEQGGVMIIDPTIASIYNVDVRPYADLVVTSLTKYASIEGDIMIGALAVNPDSPFYGDLILRTSSFYVPPYARDLARLAHEMTEAPALIERMNANAARLARFLQAHAAVRKVLFAGCSPHVKEVAKHGASGGAVITMELFGDMEKFYDTVRVMKGPSFGTRFTLLCPFMYLAHYDLVTSESGRAHLKSVGIDPELIRISVGAEDYASIEAVFSEALDSCL